MSDTETRLQTIRLQNRQKNKQPTKKNESDQFSLETLME